MRPNPLRYAEPGRYSLNPDVDFRELERRAYGGGPQERIDLLRAKHQAGMLPRSASPMRLFWGPWWVPLEKEGRIEAFLASDEYEYVMGALEQARHLRELQAGDAAIARSAPLLEKGWKFNLGVEFLNRELSIPMFLNVLYKGQPNVHVNLTSRFGERDFEQIVNTSEGAWEGVLRADRLYGGHGVYMNPDPEIRGLERSAQGGGPREEAAYLIALKRAGEASHQQLARLRQLQGEIVDPWEFVSPRASEIGHVFLEACESWRWEARAHNDPARVEGKRLCFERGGRKSLHFPVSMEWMELGTGGGAPLLLAQPMHRKDEWTPGSRPAEVFHGGGPGPDLYPCQGAPLERFYVVPSSYPMYRNPEEIDFVTDVAYRASPEGEERRIHLQAVEWFVAHGAIRYVLPEDEDISRLRETRRPLKALQTPAQIEHYLEWWDAYRQRVLVQVVNKQGARSFPGGWATDRYGWDPQADHNSRILFPFMWAKARLMKQTGKKWKNNPRRELRIPMPRSLRPATELVWPVGYPFVKNPPMGCTIVSMDESSEFDDIEAATDRDPYQIMDAAEKLFGDSGIHLASNEALHEACVEPSGRVLGVSAVGLYSSDPDEGDPLQRPRYSFSVAVAEDARRRGIADALVQSLMIAFPRDEVLLEGKVVNPHMATLLDRHGFVYDREHEDWTDHQLRQGRRMYKPNPRVS